MITTISARRLERRPNPDLHHPRDFDPDEYPILARHWFGLEARDVREVFWDLARQGHHLPAEHGVILLEGGRP
jgi:hypothetical protein